MRDAVSRDYRKIREEDSRYRDFPPWLILVMSASLLGVVLMLVILGSMISNDAYDAYDYMAGARAIAVEKAEWYPSIRPFGPAFLGVVWASGFPDRNDSMKLFRILHLQSVLISLVFLGIAALLFRVLGQGILLPVLLLALCRLFPRYGWSFMSDIPASLLLSLGFFLIIRKKRKSSDWIPAALCFGLAANFKFYLIASVLFGSLAWIVARKGEALKALYLVLLGLSAATLVHLFGVFLLTGGTLPDLVFFREVFGGQFLKGASMGAGLREPFWSYAPIFLGIFGIVSPLLLVTGLAEVLRAPRSEEWVLLIWLGGLGTLILAGGHHEARYLFPIVPPLVWLMSRGIHSLGEMLSRPGRNRRAIVVVVCLTAAAWPTIQEAVGLSEGWLRRSVQAEMCREIAAHASEESEVLFVGDFFPLILSREVFPVQDDCFSVFHMGPSQLIFFEEQDGHFSIGVPTPIGCSLPLGQLPPSGMETVIVSSGYSKHVDSRNLEWALSRPEPLLLTRRESRIIGEIQLNSPDQTSIESRPAEDGGAAETAVLEEWFEIGEDGEYESVAVLLPPEQFRLSGTEGRGSFLRVRYLPLLKIYDPAR